MNNLEFRVPKDEKEFNDLMLQIITNVIEEKHEKHFVYNRIYKKLIFFWNY